MNAFIEYKLWSTLPEFEWWMAHMTLKNTNKIQIFEALLKCDHKPIIKN